MNHNEEDQLIATRFPVGTEFSYLGLHVRVVTDYRKSCGEDFHPHVTARHLTANNEIAEFHIFRDDLLSLANSDLNY